MSSTPPSRRVAQCPPRRADATGTGLACSCCRRSGLQTFTGETTSNVKILKVSESGAASVVVTLPFDEVGGLALTPDGGRLVCTVYSSRSDLWIVENFDVLPSRQ